MSSEKMCAKLLSAYQFNVNSASGGDEFNLSGNSSPGSSVSTISLSSTSTSYVVPLATRVSLLSSIAAAEFYFHKQIGILEQTHSQSNQFVD